MKNNFKVGDIVMYVGPKHVGEKLWEERPHPVDPTL